MTTHMKTSDFADRSSTERDTTERDTSEHPSAASRSHRRPDWIQSHPLLAGLAATAGVLAASAFVNHRLAKRAERRNPPQGRFVNVQGVRLHYIDRGEGPPLVLLHGNGSMIQDFTLSGLVGSAARRHRVVVFDRPGYGHSTRPRDRIWNAKAQADVIHAALERIGVSSAVVLGHSWGASVAVELALRHPRTVSGLILASGYYYPTMRADAAIFSVPAIPVLGDVARHAVLPIVSRLAWPFAMRKIFRPAPVPARYDRFPKELAVRPSQLRAQAAEAALLIPSAEAASERYASLKMPVAIVSGADDRLIDPVEHSGRLHRALPQSTFRPVPGSGHMVHQTSPETIMSAIDEVFAQLDARGLQE